jgi:hypothetical protein
MAEYFSIDQKVELTVDLVNKTFFDFAATMSQWEKEFYKKRMEALEANVQNPSLREQGHADLINIFSLYVINDKRNYDRLENLVCSINPDYEFDNDSIGNVDIKKKTATIEFRKRGGISEIYRLTFFIDNMRCKIKKREFLDNGKWRTTYV